MSVLMRPSVSICFLIPSCKVLLNFNRFNEPLLAVFMEIFFVFVCNVDSVCVEDSVAVDCERMVLILIFLRVGSSIGGDGKDNFNFNLTLNEAGLIMLSSFGAFSTIGKESILVMLSRMSFESLGDFGAGGLFAFVLLELFGSTSLATLVGLVDLTELEDTGFPLFLFGCNFGINILYVMAG